MAARSAGLGLRMALQLVDPDASRLDLGSQGFKIIDQSLLDAALALGRDAGVDQLLADRVRELCRFLTPVGARGDGQQGAARLDLGADSLLKVGRGVVKLE